MSEPTPQNEPQTFVETALRLGGKGEEEARRTAAVDRADEQVETLFDPRYQTIRSPVHRAVWEDPLPVELFQSRPKQVSPSCQKVMDDSERLVRRHLSAGTLYGADGRIRPEVLAELGQAGYWGLLISPDHGGQGAPFSAFAHFLMRMSLLSPDVAGMASVHGCIGAVDPLLACGNPQQQAKYLPLLAGGRRLSGFALTEPGAGSDLTALRTTARLQGDHYLVTGEKLFITNAVPGRTIGLVCLIEGKPQVLIADLPDREDDTFQVVPYGIYALRRMHNNGLRFKDFPVPRENLLVMPGGDGLTVAYHGLNRGRVTLCAQAAGSMRVMLANLLPWGRYRRTYGASIDTRELVRHRIGRLAGMIVGCDAMAQWCGGLLDEGYRGEMECIVAKIFASESQKEAAIELFMKTHGGRAFLKGHLFGDNVHDYLAPCIYEGEGEMLGLAFFKSLVKNHGKTFFEPVGRALHASGIGQPNPFNPVHLWHLRKALPPYLLWKLKQRLPAPRPQMPPLPGPLEGHAAFAAQTLRRSRLKIDRLMSSNGLRLPDRQCQMAHLSRHIQQAVVMLVSALWAGRSDDPVLHGAADVLCRDLQRSITGRGLDGAYFRAGTALGEAVVAGGFHSIAGVEAREILMGYKDS